MSLEFQFAHRGSPPPYSMLRGQLSLHKAGALAARLPPRILAAYPLAHSLRQRPGLTRRLASPAFEGHGKTRVR